MPRYYIDIFNDTVVLDDEGYEFADLAAARAEVRKALSAMMHDEKDFRPAVQLRADVRDEAGERVMTASLLMVIDETR